MRLVRVSLQWYSLWRLIGTDPGRAFIRKNGNSAVRSFFFSKLTLANFVWYFDCAYVLRVLYRDTCNTANFQSQHIYRYYRKLAKCGNCSQEPGPQKRNPWSLKIQKHAGSPVYLVYPGVFHQGPAQKSRNRKKMQTACDFDNRWGAGTVIAHPWFYMASWGI